MTTKQLEELKSRARSPWCAPRASSIHDRGLFATRPIPRATRVIEYLGEKITHAESERRGLELLRRARAKGGGAVYLFSLDAEHDLDGNVPWNIAGLANHSCEPNCATDLLDGRVWIIALREIAPGEEITFDYGFALEGWRHHPCRCGAPSCAGYIVATELRPRLGQAIRARETEIAENGSVAVTRRLPSSKKEHR